MSYLSLRRLWCLGIGCGLIAVPAATATSVYVGLGDSITFGETDLNYVQSYGDRGYVGKFADILASRDGGMRPTVVNLAIDGETASSFMSGVGRTPPVVGRTDAVLAAQNLNYAASPSTPQAVMFNNLAASEAAAGNTIGTISISLGFNELAALSSLPPNEALAMLPTTLAAYEASYTAVLSDVRLLEPTSQLYLLGYYNPFVLDPKNPAAPIFAQGGPELNSIIQTLATEYDAQYVDTNTPFLGRIGSLTYISAYPAGSTSPGNDPGTEPIGDVHPNNNGYSVIANQLTDVPEPSGLGFMALAAVCGVGWKLRRLLVPQCS